MKITISRPFRQFLVLHAVVCLSLLTLALLGRVPDNQAGWLTCPPDRLVCAARRRAGLRPSPAGDGLWDYVATTGYQPLVRSVVLLGLWLLGGRRGPLGLMWWPWWLWLWQVGAVVWPGLGQQRGWRTGQWLLWQGQRVLLVGYGSGVLSAVWQVNHPVDRAGWVFPLGLGCLGGATERPVVAVTHLPAGGYQARLRGEFTLQVAEDDPVRVRILLLFLGLLDSPGQTRRSRRTRDGRTPVVRQVQLAAWFGLPQPVISRIEDYWRRGAWPELLSQSAPEILTPELIHRVVQVCVTCPHWTVAQVHAYLRPGVAVTRRQVRQAMHQSGWLALRQELRRRYQWTPAAFQPRDEWLVHQLLDQIQRLLTCLDGGQALPPEDRIALTDLLTGCQAAGLGAVPPVKVWPWLTRVQQLVWGDWSTVLDETIRCPACGSTQVVRKSRTPRRKKFYDAQGHLQEVAVYRYYCRNAACVQGSFTYLPPGLVPYSRHRLEVHLLALQAYAWSYSTYRRVGQALQVSQMTVYRWVSAWGDQLLPVAAWFGLVRSSGVVGVDEKYVLVPKNHKPAEPRRRWMYVYLAVDVYTYDLLHIALYAHNTHESAQAFLLAVRAKGYHPQVVVTDLRRDYGSAIAQVFPQAEHHECLFHAEQDIGHYLRETWGRDYADRQPAAAQLRDEVVHLFQARTQPAVAQRYQALLDRRAEYVAQLPELQWVFAYLDRHWPCLVNSIGSELIPATNNAVEMVIRRFDQHYQNFCGFESIETAQVYLGVFEKIYRFTPFSADAQPRIRGQSPLQLAGYDLSHRPMPWLCQGYSFDWPVTSSPQEVPNP
jgi:transposase-like protein